MSNKNLKTNTSLSGESKNNSSKKHRDWEDVDEETEIPDPSEKDLLEINDFDDYENFSDYDEIENDDLNYYFNEDDSYE